MLTFIEILLPMGLETIKFRYLQLQSGNIVLDIGCGQGRHCLGVLEQGAGFAIGIDIGIQDLRLTRQAMQTYYPEKNANSLHLCVASGLALPFPNQAFNQVICSEVLEHIEDYNQVLKEIYRVLKPGGILAVSVPKFGPEWICWKLAHDYANTPGGHIRIFRSKVLRQAIIKTGMVFIHRHWAHALHTPYWWLKCIFWNSADCNYILKMYHRLLLWDITNKPWITRFLERVLNPIIGKSIVMYFVRAPALTNVQ